MEFDENRSVWKDIATVSMIAEADNPNPDPDQWTTCLGGQFEIPSGASYLIRSTGCLPSVLHGPATAYCDQYKEVR